MCCSTEAGNRCTLLRTARTILLPWHGTCIDSAAQRSQSPEPWRPVVAIRPAAGSTLGSDHLHAGLQEALLRQQVRDEQAVR